MSKRLAVVALVLAAELVFVVAAWGHHTDNMFRTASWSADCSTDTPCQSDNSTLTYFRQSSLNATSQWNVQNVLTTKYGPTDLSIVEEAPPVYSGGAETDIVYQVNGQLAPQGLTVCDDPISSLKCDQFFVIFRDNPNYASNNAIACHETGHAVGLLHGQQASPVRANSDQSLECLAIPAPFVLGAHSVPQINATY
jgi:hypothetical protein